MISFPVILVMALVLPAPALPPVCVIFGQSRRFVARWLFDAVGESESVTKRCIGRLVEVESIVTPDFTGNGAIDKVDALAKQIYSAGRVTRFVLSLSTNPRFPQVRRDLLVLRTLVGQDIWSHLDVFHPLTGTEATLEFKRERENDLMKGFQKVENGFDPSYTVPHGGIRHHWTGIRKTTEMRRWFLKGSSTVYDQCRNEKNESERCKEFENFCQQLQEKPDGFETWPENYLRTCLSSRPSSVTDIPTGAMNLLMCLKHGGQQEISELGWDGLAKLKEVYSETKNKNLSTALAFILLRQPEVDNAVKTFFPGDVSGLVAQYSDFDCWQACEESKELLKLESLDSLDELGQKLLQCIKGIRDDALIKLRHSCNLVNPSRQLAVVNSVSEEQQPDLVSKLAFKIVLGHVECFLQKRLVAVFTFNLHQGTEKGDIIKKTMEMDEIRRIKVKENSLHIKVLAFAGGSQDISDSITLQEQIRKSLKSPPSKMHPLRFLIDIQSDCEDHWCDDRGTCIDGKCICDDGFKGKNCQEKEVCKCPAPDGREVRGPPCTKQNKEIRKDSYLWLKLCAGSIE